MTKQRKPNPMIRVLAEVAVNAALKRAERGVPRQGRGKDFYAAKLKAQAPKRKAVKEQSKARDE